MKKTKLLVKTQLILVFDNYDQSDLCKDCECQVHNQPCFSCLDCFHLGQVGCVTPVQVCQVHNQPCFSCLDCFHFGQVGCVTPVQALAVCACMSCHVWLNRYEMLRTEDGSIRGTVKMIETIKMHEMQRGAGSRHAGDASSSSLLLPPPLPNPPTPTHHPPPSLFPLDHLFGLMVKASTSRADDPGFETRLHWDFSASSHTSNLKTGAPVATLAGVWPYRVSTGTGWPGVSML